MFSEPSYMKCPNHLIFQPEFPDFPATSFILIVTDNFGIQIAQGGAMPK